MSSFPDMPKKQRFSKSIIALILFVTIIPTAIVGAYIISNMIVLNYPITTGVTVSKVSAPTGVPYPADTLDLPTNGTAIVTGVTYKTGLQINVSASSSYPSGLAIGVDIAHVCVSTGLSTCALDYSAIWNIPSDVIVLQAYINGTFTTIPGTWNDTSKHWLWRIIPNPIGAPGSTVVALMITFCPVTAAGSYTVKFWVQDT